MVPPGRWFTRKPLLALKLLTVYVHRRTLPQSRIRSTAPSGREPGWGAYHSPDRSKTATLRAIFIAPTKLKRFWFLPFNGGHSLSLAFARQLPQRGSRGGAVPFNVPPRNRNVAGDFHRPYETQKILAFTIQRGTLPQSASLTAPSGREPGGTGGGKSQKCRQKPPGLFGAPGVKCVCVG